jgi:O-antigen ligase
MVQENVTWFSLKAAAYTGYPVLVVGRSRAGAACAGPPPAPPGTPRGGPAQLPRTFSQPARTQLWAAALRMLRARPLLGIGPDGFRLRYGIYMRPPLTTWDTRILANQLFLEIFADLGLLGGALFFGFLAAVWWPLIVALWTRRDPLPSVWQIGLIAAFAALLGHGLVDYLLDAHAIFLLLWLLCGLASTVRIVTDATAGG